MPQYTVAELTAAVDEAHRLGRKLTAHAHGPAGIAVAVEAGVDGLEHCSFRVAGGRHAEPQLVDQIAEQQIAVCPTVGMAPGAVLRPETAALVDGFVPILERMHRAGVRLVAGTAFVLHGWPKIQNPTGWMGPDAPVPGALQAAAAVAEFGGGVACGSAIAKGP